MHTFYEPVYGTVSGDHVVVNNILVLEKTFHELHVLYLCSEMAP